MRLTTVQKYIPDVVHRDLVTNVAILGGTSTGKTTLTKALAKKFDTTFMPEYGEDFWHQHADENGELSELQLAQLAREHLQREEELLLEADEFLFTDTNAVTTGMFSKWYHGTINPRLRDMMDRARSRYDVVLLCDDDIPFEPAPGRGGEKGRETLQRMHESWLNRNNVPYYRISGDLHERTMQAVDILLDFDKWDYQQN